MTFRTAILVCAAVEGVLIACAVAYVLLRN